MNKAELIVAWRVQLVQRLERARESQAEARTGMRVDGDHRPANRGERAAVTSQGYLTQGLAKRLDALEETIELLDRVGSGPRNQVVMGAVFRAVHEDGTELSLALFPGGDATILELEGEEVMVLSPQAPLVQAFLGLEEGDEAEVQIAAHRGIWELNRVF